MIREVVQAGSRRHSRSWSIARRLFGISLLLILLQALGSSVVTTKLRHHFFHQFLEETLSRQIVSSYNELELRPAVALQVLDDQPVAPDIDNGRRGEPIQTPQLAAGLRAFWRITFQDADDRAPQNEVAPLPRGDEAFRS